LPTGKQNPEANMEEAGLFVKNHVDGGMMLKRLRPAPQGRAHRIRKRSNHVTIVLGSINTQSNLTRWDKRQINWK
jgi:large subunit ribosomal protein L22